MKSRPPLESAPPDDLGEHVQAERALRMAACYSPQRPDEATVSQAFAAFGRTSRSLPMKRRRNLWHWGIVVALVGSVGVAWAVASGARARLSGAATEGSSQDPRGRAQRAQARPARPATEAPQSEQAPAPIGASFAAAESTSDKAEVTPPLSQPGPGSSGSSAGRAEPVPEPDEIGALWQRAARALAEHDYVAADRAFAQLARRSGSTSDAASLSRAELWIARDRWDLARPTLESLVRTGSSPVVRQRAAQLLQKR